MKKFDIFEIVKISEFGRSIFDHVLVSGGREKVGSELGGLGHVASNLHLSLHKRNLGVKLSHADLVEISVSHSESSIRIFRCTSFSLALTTL